MTRLLAALALLSAAPAQARVLLSQPEALRLAFPESGSERRTAFLTEEQARQAQAAGRVPVSGRVWTYYEGVSGGRRRYAYFETHTVRSETETFMTVVDDAGSVAFVELLAFHEPDDYLPARRWLDTFHGRAAADDLFVRRGIRNISGASLTSSALTDGVRRILAVHRVLHPQP